MPAVARIGDSCSHGGSISSGSMTSFADGKGVARVGDTYNCPVHGKAEIMTGSSLTMVEGKALARVGDSTTCGASITSGSPTVFENG